MNMFKSSQNHPLPVSRKKCLPWNPVPGPKKVADHWFKIFMIGWNFISKMERFPPALSPLSLTLSGFLDNAPKGAITFTSFLLLSLFFIADKKYFWTAEDFSFSQEHGLCPVCLGSAGLCRWFCLTAVVFPYVLTTLQLHLSDQAYFMFAGVRSTGCTFGPPVSTLSFLSWDCPWTYRCIQPGCASSSQKWTDVNAQRPSSITVGL